VANVDKPDVSATAESGAANASQAHGDRPIEAGQVDRAFHATLARLTGGISPVARSLAYFDWASHLAAAPQRRMEIAQDAVRTAGRIFESALHCTEPGYGPWSLIKPQPQDRRFAASEWESPPFNLLAQAFLLREQWWHNATVGVRGAANEAIVEFSVRHVLDMLAPSNFAASNPEVLQKAFQSGGENFLFGWQNWCSDLMRLDAMARRAIRRALRAAADGRYRRGRPELAGRAWDYVHR
jgi:polyhydroxyalkanoate synthase